MPAGAPGWDCVATDIVGLGWSCGTRKCDERGVHRWDRWDNGQAASTAALSNNLDLHLILPSPIRPKTAVRQSNGYRMKIQRDG